MDRSLLHQDRAAIEDRWQDSYSSRERTHFESLMKPPWTLSLSQERVNHSHRARILAGFSLIEL
jgi:hypothetical protein